MSQENIDLSLNKMTRITERTRLQFRAEAFNALNHFYINEQGFNNLDSATFGSIDKSTVGTRTQTLPAISNSE